MPRLSGFLLDIIDQKSEVLRDCIEAVRSLTINGTAAVFEKQVEELTQKTSNTFPYIKENIMSEKRLTGFTYIIQFYIKTCWN
jgi:hypothetical protein